MVRLLRKTAFSLGLIIVMLSGVVGFPVETNAGEGATAGLEGCGAAQCQSDSRDWCTPGSIVDADWGDRNVVTLEQDFGLSQYRPKRIPAQTVFDARRAHWTVDNCGVGGVGNQNRDVRLGPGANRYPIIIESVPHAMWLGGVITSNVPQDTSWEDQYCNSAVFEFRDADVVVEGVRIDGAWDGVRFKLGAEQASHSLLQHSWFSNVRDDAVENDDLKSLTVRDTLFDGCFVGISIDPTSSYKGPDRFDTDVLVLDGVLLRVKSYLYKGTLQPGTFIKGHAASPAVEIYDSIFAFDADSRIMNSRMALIWNSKVRACSNNQLLWLSDEPFPRNFPTPPSCFTVVTGAEARRIWESSRAEWINRHPNVGGGSEIGWVW